MNHRSCNSGSPTQPKASAFTLVAAIWLLLSTPVLAATYVVTTTADTGNFSYIGTCVGGAGDGAPCCDGDFCSTAGGTCQVDESCGNFCSLTDAINFANCHPGADTVLVPSGSYHLVDHPVQTILNNSLTVEGEGADFTLIQNVLFNVNTAGTINIAGVTLEAGDNETGGVLIGNNPASAVTIVDCRLMGSAAWVTSGVEGSEVNSVTLTHTIVTGFYERGVDVGPGQVSITDSDISENGVDTTSEAIRVRGGHLDLNSSSVRSNHGGAITISDASATIFGSSIADNEKGNFGEFAGIYFDGTNQTLTLTNSFVTGNNSDDGAGIEFRRGSAMTVSGSTISGNAGGSSYSGIHMGGDPDVSLTITDSTVSANTSDPYAGILVDLSSGGSVTIRNTTVETNVGTNQSGIVVSGAGSTTIIDSTVRNNAGTVGGGIASSGPVTIENTTVSGNSGPGLDFFGSALVTNSTITGNSGFGVGSQFEPILTFNNCTISGNDVGIGGDGYVNLSNTIVALNSQNNCAIVPTSNGHNMDDDGTCGFNSVGDLSNVANAGLAPLGNYGGPTQTQALCTGVGTPDASCTGLSPALDAGNPATPGSGGNACEAKDQRGETRPFGIACDIGAYEKTCQTGDTDGDGLCNESDPCTNVGGSQNITINPRIMLGKINTDNIANNDSLKVSGEFILPAASGFAMLNPVANGARAVIRSAAGIPLVDVTLASGAFGGKGTRGWALNRKATKWTFQDKTGTSANGITKMIIQDRSSKAPRRVKVTVIGKNGAYPITAGDSPIGASVVLGGQASSNAGECGEIAFSAQECAFNRSGSRLTCKL